LVVNQSTGANPHAEAMSMIQKSVGTKHYRIFDLDSKEPEKLEQVLSHLSEGSYRVIETRGGYHILIKPKFIESSKKAVWFKNIINIEGIDSGETNSDIMCPVPGTYQGGFTPKFII
jgi:tetrahydrodipicolinate N-succinyltransferase